MVAQFLIALLALAPPGSINTAALSEGIYVIGHSGLHLTAADVREVYLGEKELALGVRLSPVDNVSVQKQFLATFLKLEVRKYNILWAKKGFRDALNPPLVRANDAEVIQAVRSTPGGIGYVSSPPAGVDIIVKLQP
jgi:hypothetical protein